MSRRMMVTAGGASRPSDPPCSPAARWRGAVGWRRVAGLAVALAFGSSLAGCVAPQLALLQSGLDSLRTQVDTLQVRDSISYRVLADLRHDLSEQRDILLSTRASSGSTTQELFSQMGRLEGKLDEVMGRFNTLSQHPAPTVAAPGAQDPQQLYEQATQDLTQGRYPLALQEFRDYVRGFPTSELADNAQYGVGECFFAQSQFDSAAVEYEGIERLAPQGDRVPAGLWKLALSREKLGQAALARRTLEDLVKRFPLSGEAQLARDRLAKPKGR
jgi:tol-pal system protein YbgF